ERKHLEVLDRALAGLTELRAGVAGLLTLRRAAFSPETDPVTRAARVWTSGTPFTVTRHLQQVTAHDALRIEIERCCAARGLPPPTVALHDVRGIPGRGLQGRVTLEFRVAADGPIVLGRTRYLGGGLFRASA